MFPSSLKSDVDSVARIIPKENHLPHKLDGSLIVDSDLIQIYSRIYNREPNISAVMELTKTQQLILHCIYTRHYDGFIRQKYLTKLLGDQRSWTAPFIITLIGEYVIEIIEAVESGIKDEDVFLYKKFIDENPIFWEKTKARIISYWNEYYRKSFKYKHDYPAMKIVRIIEK